MRKVKRVVAFMIAMMLIMATVSQDVYAYAAPFAGGDARASKIADMSNFANSVLADGDDVEVIDDEEAYAKAYYEATFGKEEFEAPEEYVAPEEEPVDDGITVEDTVVTGVTATSGDYTYNLNSNDEATLTKYTGTDKEVVIPSSIDGYPVVGISSLFSGNTTIESVTIPNTVLTIGGSSFRNASGLKTVVIPASVTKIDSSAFYGCTALASIKLPDSLQSIGSSAFTGCNSMESITIPASVTSINDGAFSSVKKIIFADGMVTIPANACRNASALESVVIPSTVTAIGNYAFYNCDALVSIVLPDTVTSIGTYLFDNCAILESVTLPKDVTTISSYTFRSCEKLATVVLPDALTKIDAGAFYSCKALTGFTIPDTVTNIGQNAFYSCTGIESITIPATVTSVGSGAFTGIAKIIFGEGTTNIINNVCDGNTALTEIVLPAGIKSIGNYAFRGCTALESIAIPSTVESIGNYAFANCTKFTAITIPNSVTELGTYVFSGCSALATINYPTGLTTIPNYCFYNCKALEEFTIASNITAIGADAFYGCIGLKKIVVPDSVTTIGNYAFYGCTALEEIVIGKNAEFGSGVFGGKTYTGDCGPAATYTCSLDDRTLTIEGTGKIADYTADAGAPWAKCATVFKSVDIAEEITAIGDYAFTGMTNAEYVLLPEGTISIGDSAFANWDSVGFIDLPSGITEVGSNAFSDCDSLEEITFTGTAPVIGANFASSLLTICIYYPETAAGWTNRILTALTSYDVRKYDDTLEPIDVVLTLDTSGSMSGRMTDLKDVSTDFIMKVGGYRNNVRLALVEYNSNAYERSNFTYDRTKLVKAVEKLKSTGNTEYLKALGKADEILDVSTCENRVIVLFSDGAPTDSKDAIYELAEKLREKYTIFTVGLGVAQSVVLETIAGAKHKFFLAKNIDELVAAFANLSDFINRKDTTEITMKRNNIRYNVMTEGPFKFTKDSTEYVSLDVIPSIDAEPAKYVIAQDGKNILSSTNGNFGNIQPGKIFTSEGKITLSMYDEDGAIIGKAYTLDIVIIDEYTITYMLKNVSTGVFEVYTTQKVAMGSSIVAPTEPTDKVYDFKGWYGRESGSGLEFFSIFNAYNRARLDNDLTLYGFWKSPKGTIIKGVENWEIANSGLEFCNIHWWDNPVTMTEKEKKKYHYDITDSDFNKLKDDNLTSNPLKHPFVRNRLNARKDDPWGGSCYGMAASTILSKAGKVDINDFDHNFDNLGDLKALYVNALGTDPSNIESMINYYMLGQFLPDLYSMYTSHTYNAKKTSSYLGGIVDKMKSTEYPVVLVIDVHGKSGGAHAVVGYDFVADDANGEYTFKVYDVNYPKEEYDINIIKSGDTYSIDQKSGYSVWDGKYKNTEAKNQLFFRYAITVEEFKNDIAILKTSALETAAVDNTILLSTNYEDFTITYGENVAIVEDGEVTVSGNLILESYGNMAMADAADDDYQFSLAALTGEAGYTITPVTTGLDEYKTLFGNDSFYADVTSGAAVKISIDGNGKLVTDSETAVWQSIFYSNIKNTTPWEYITLDAEAKSFVIGADESGVSVSTTGSASMDIVASDGINEVSFDDIDVAAITISSDEDRNCIIKDASDSSTIATKSFGYRVVFDSNGGSVIETYKNVSSGSLIAMPADPSREGFAFTGWFKDKECKTAWDFTKDVVTSNIVLYAGWEVDPNYFVTVTFKMYNGKEEHFYTCINTKLTKEDCPELTIEDKTWYKDPECRKAWDYEKDVIKHNIVLYSVGWDKKDGDTEEPTPDPSPTPTPDPTPSPEPVIDPHADDNKVVVKQKIDVSGMFDLSSLGKDEKLAGYIVSEGKKNASITKKGLLSPKKPGDITIEAYKVVKEGKKKVKKTVSSIKLVVVKPEFDKAAMVGRKPGQIIDITKLISIPMNQKVEWSASKSSAATMDDKGMVTIGNKSGKLTVTATLTNKDGKKVKIKGKLVIKLPKLTKTKLSIKAGKSAKLSVRNIVDEASQKITWSTSNAAVAVYDASAGKVVANGKGEAVITAEIEGVAYTCNVKVK